MEFGCQVRLDARYGLGALDFGSVQETCRDRDAEPGKFEVRGKHAFLLSEFASPERHRMTPPGWRFQIRFSGKRSSQRSKT
jgi:hypothetical protein